MASQEGLPRVFLWGISKAQVFLQPARDTMAHPVKHLNGRVSMGERENGSRAQKGTALGSSQKDECIGDFCSYDVSVNFTEMESQEDSDPLTEARKKLNTRDMSTLMHRRQSQMFL